MDNPFEIKYDIPSFNLAGQKSESADWIKNLTNFIGSQESLPAMFDRLSGQLGIPQLQEQTQRLGEATGDITSQLFALPENVAGRTRESIVTAPQQARMISAEAEPMQKNLAQLSTLADKFGSRLSTAQTNLGTMMGLYQAQQEKELLPWEKGYDLLTQQQAREFSGYTFENEQELNKLIANQNAGLTWNNAERQRASDLAIAELNYKSALEQITKKGEQDRQTQNAPRSQSLADMWATMYKAKYG